MQWPKSKFDKAVTFILVLLNLPTIDPPTNDQPTTDHLSTDPPTHWQPTHRPTDAITTVYLKDLKIAIYSLYRIQTQLLRYKTLLRCIIFKIFDLFASIKKHSEELIMVIFFRFKLYKRMKISIRPGSFIKRHTSGTSSDNEWQQMTTSDNEWYNDWQRMTMSDNEWQRMTTSDHEWCNKWQRMTRSNKTSDNKWQQIAMSGSKWQQWYNQWKRHSTLQGMDECRHFNDKNRYITTSRDGWLQLEWLNK